MARGSRFVVHGPDVEMATAIALPGAFNISNALLAFATLVSAGVDPRKRPRGSPACLSCPAGWRLYRSASRSRHSSTTHTRLTRSSRLLTTVRATAKAGVIVVLGCGGDRDRAKRPLMGAAAARLADVAILTSDNPRSEEPAQILAAMLEGAMGVAPGSAREVIVELDRRTAIAIAVERARAG